MSKNNRNKKTPMFVSNMISNYDFVDYTQPAQSAFGNPNPNSLGSASPAGNKPSQPPKKSETTNWFEQMLSGQQNKKKQYQNPFQNSSSTTTTTKTQSYQSNFSSLLNPGYGGGPTISQSANSITQPQKFSTNGQGFKKQSFGSGKDQYSISFNEQSYTSSTNNALSSRTQPSGGNRSQFDYNISSPTTSYQQKKYEFSSKKEDTYTPSYKNEFSKKNQYTDEPSYPKQQFKPAPPSYATGPSSSGTSSSSGSGFTDQSLVNSLPEPARSNILAMIKRSKGMNN